jgi:cytochrome c oxidase cbb3-type subunit 3
MSENVNKKQQADIFDDEKDVLLDHNYDGIRELDNHMPGWWVFGFWFCILFAVLYLLFYHVLGWGPSSKGEYEAEMAGVVSQRPTTPTVNTDDWVELTFLTDVESVEKGKVIYNTICNVCHGANGEGLVGPNLTDEYWVNGCDPKSIMISVQTGFPAKGMPAYGGGKQLNTDELQLVSSYIHSLKGSKPANAKPIDPIRELICE